MTFDLDGFLSPRIEREVATIDESHGVLFEEARSINRVGMKLIDQITVMNDETAQVIFFALYLRLLSHYQACTGQAEIGSAYPAKASLRFMMEISFYCIALAENPKFIERIMDAELLKAQDRARAIKRYKKRNEIEDDDYKQAVHVVEHFKGQGKKLPVRDVAEAAGALDTYDTAYVSISDAVHSSLVSLEEAMTIDRETMRVTHMDFRRDYADAHKTVFLAMTCLVSTIQSAARMFDFDEPEEIQRTRNFLVQQGYIDA